MSWPDVMSTAGGFTLDADEGIYITTPPDTRTVPPEQRPVATGYANRFAPATSIYGPAPRAPACPPTRQAPDDGDGRAAQKEQFGDRNRRRFGDGRGGTSGGCRCAAHGARQTAARP